MGEPTTNSAGRSSPQRNSTGSLSGPVRQLAIRAFKAIDCQGLARVDFFLTDDGPVVNEINTMPGFTAISMYPKLWEASGIGFRELIDRLIALAFEIHQEKARTKYAIELPEGSGGALAG